MTKYPALIAAALSLVATPAATAPTLAQMRWQRRVLLLFVGDGGAAMLRRQQVMAAAWKEGAAARDLTVVTVGGDTVSGAAERAAALRRRYRPTGGFTAILIGKDGGEKLRSAAPISPARLAETIDAMPMRQAGER